MDFDTLVLSGGSVRAVCHIGCIRYLEHVACVHGIRTVAGASAGALIAFLFAMGCGSDQMRLWITRVFREARVNQLDVAGIFDLYQQMGVDSMSRFEALFKVMMRRFLDVDDMTFVEFAKATGRDLIICASDVTHARPVYFSVDTYPDLSVITALKASICIPLLFRPIVIDDVYYVDGGIFENLPLSAVVGRRTCSRILAVEVMIDGLCTDVGLEDDLRKSPASISPTPPSNVVEYLAMLLRALLVRANDATISCCRGSATTGPTIVRIDLDKICNVVGKNLACFSLESMTFVIDDDEVLMAYIDAGYTRMDAHFSPLQKRIIDDAQTSSDAVQGSEEPPPP